MLRKVMLWLSGYGDRVAEQRTSVQSQAVAENFPRTICASQDLNLNFNCNKTDRQV